MGDYDKNNSRHFVPFLSELFSLADQISADEIDKPSLYEFITAQSTDPE